MAGLFPNQRWFFILALTGAPFLHALGYIDIPYTLGRIIQESTHVMVLRVESVDRQKNLIIYRKLRDIKGVHPSDTIKHEIGQLGMHPREWQTIMQWAEPGKRAVLFHNGSGAETCIDSYWYQTTVGEWWRLIHAEPIFLVAFAGSPDKLAAAVEALIAGREAVIPCLMHGDFDALQLRTARRLRMRASMSRQDYNFDRDFVGWGAEEYERIEGMPGFTHLHGLGHVSRGVAGITAVDFSGDGKPDLCLYGENQVSLFKNNGGLFEPVSLPFDGGARSGDWADFNRDGRPDLLLAVPGGLRLFCNAGDTFRDVTGVIPVDGYLHPTTAAWLDYDGDGWPDILFADGFRGLRLYRNRGETNLTAQLPGFGTWYYAGPFDNPGGAGFAAVYPPETGVDLRAEYSGKNGEKVVWRAANFRDGEVNSLLLFKPELNQDAVIYLYRELNVSSAVELPVSLGSDDTLSVWLNGMQVHAENVYRACTPDQVRLILKLRPGKNFLLLKICQGGGDFAFYFKASEIPSTLPAAFEDVSEAVGLGVSGVGGRLKGDHIAVADVNRDGRADFLFSAGRGTLVLNTVHGFREARSSGIDYAAGGVMPVFGDFNGDGFPDLFVPQRDRPSCLFVNEGKGRFWNIAGRSSALAKTIPQAVTAVWSDF
ncbi:MAG: VCBS repeat-containing protein, partial [Kiritimatiellae bacterium]|nr:VCBS repeat-containing protein [Kiritimatiellia bacterium]